MVSPGENFSHYKIISAIGAGGMGEVFLAEDTRLERRIALKVLLPSVADDDERVRRFEQEAKSASALNHPNILTVFEIGTYQGAHYLATEFIRGRTLRDHMNETRVRLRDGIDIVLQIAAALGAAHEEGIVHRDVKPENVMLRDDGLVKVLDFGLAKLTSSSPASVNTTLPQVITEPGMLVGTVAYMSPEQARGRDLDPRSDIFSLGIMMFEVFAGRRPFDGESQLDLISSILKDEPPHLRSVNSALPRQLERIVEKSLRKDRDHRYQHIKDLQIDLEDLRDELEYGHKLSESSETIVMDRSLLTGDDAGKTDVIKPTLTASISMRRFTLVHAILFAFAVVALTAVIWYFVPNMAASPPTPGSYKTTEVATWSSAAGELFSTARFSPDGKMIAFSSTKSGTKSIWVTQTGSTEAIQITTDGFANTDPIWSPKGDEIAYFSDRNSDDDSASKLSGIWRINALGGTSKLIGPLAERNVELRRWSPSGKIYYQVNSDLNAMDIADGRVERVISLPREASLINISPDETSVAYSIKKGDKWRIVIKDLNSGSSEQTAVSVDGEINGLVWQPDKSRLFYASIVDGISQVFATTPGTERSIQVSRSETDLSVVDASPDGHSILANSAKEESNLWRVNVASGQEAPISRELPAELWPAISPDDSKVLFQAIRDLSQGNNLRTGSIAVKNIKQREESEPFSVIAQQGFLPVWSPDAINIAFIKEMPDAAKDLFMVNANGGGERRLTTSGVATVGYSVSPYNTATSHSFAFSPNGSRIAYLSNHDGASNVWIVDTPTGTTSRLTSNSDASRTLFSPFWSADGKRIAFSYEIRSQEGGSKPSYGISIIDVDTLTASGAFSSPRSHRLIGWLGDNALMIAEPSKIFSGLPPETALKRIDLKTNTESSISVLKNAYVYNMFLSDDQRFLAFAARNDDRDDLWVIPSNGGTARKITSNNDSALYYSRLAWFHDGSSIAFGKQTRFSLLSMITGID